MAFTKQTLQKIGVSFWLIALVCTLLSACSATGSSNRLSNDERARIDVGLTTYQGAYSEVDGIIEFLGLPFAKPPIGDLRWVEAQAIQTKLIEPTALNAEHQQGTVKNSTDVEKATEFASACMQGPHIANWYKGVIESFGGDSESFATPEVSEDCLYLNIWSPGLSSQQERAKGAKLPVIVFLHGGSNKGGWSYEPNYIGRKLAAKGAVVVTVAYRLGVFGFFSHPELDIANFALTDQIAALEWVQKNISLVGGDASNITVVGESAGANDIAYLVASPLARGLFRRVIHQSAGWAMYGTDEKSTIDKLGLQFSSAVLNASITDNLMQSAVSKLRGISSEEILRHSEKVYANHFFDAVVDKHTIIKPFSETVGLGELARVDMMIGTNANEALMYLPNDATLKSWLDDQGSVISNRTSKAIVNYLKNDESRHRRSKLDLLATSYNYACPSLSFAKAQAKNGGKSWVYYFSKRRDGQLASQMGAYHGAELPYVFNTHDDWLPTSNADKQLSRNMMSYWLNFAKSGNPNGVHKHQGSLAYWAAFSISQSKVQFLDEKIKSASHPSERLCELLEY